jgi:anti-sigma factor RsiW
MSTDDKMSTDDDLLSSHIDGELSAGAAQALERRLAAEPGLRQRLEMLREADRQAARRLAQVLDDPVPLALVRALSQKPGAARAPSPQARSGKPPARMPVAAVALAGALVGALAAGVALIAVLPAVQPAPVAQARSWTEEVVAYHRIYAKEGRHLVEVGADEPDHIRAWLGDRIGRPFDIPDLAAHGLTFRGARLLVAAGKPVAQLVYTLDDGSVVALCMTQKEGAPDMPAELSRIDEFDAVTWRDAGTAIVLLGPADRLDLMAVSQGAGRLL